MFPLIKDKETVENVMIYNLAYTIIFGGSANLADNKIAEIIPTDPTWIRFSEGLHEIVFDFGKPVRIDEVFIRSLNAEKSNIGAIGKATVSFLQDGKAYTTATMTGAGNTLSILTTGGWMVCCLNISMIMPAI